MTDLSKHILEEIKDQKITPRPKWEFLVRDYVIWGIFGLFVLIGSISVSVFIFMITDRDWDIYQNLGKGFGEFLLVSIPYFWIILIAAFSIFAYYDLRKTREGYKYTFTKIGLLNIGLSVLLGTIFFATGFGGRIENALADNIPFYHMMTPLRTEQLWNSPERGLIVGEITDFIGEDDFNIRDLQNKNWLITCINCLWRGGARANTGIVVKILGKQLDDGTLQATEVRPWKPGCGANINLPPAPRFGAGCHGVAR